MTVTAEQLWDQIAETQKIISTFLDADNPDWVSLLSLDEYLNHMLYMHKRDVKDCQCGCGETFDITTEDGFADFEEHASGCEAYQIDW